MGRNEDKLRARCEEFNKNWAIGSAVKYHPVIGGEEYQVFKTRSAAYVMSAHTAVIFLDGKSGCVSLDAIEPVAVEAK